MVVTNKPEMKLRLLWIVIGYALVALVVYLSLTSSPVDMGELFPHQDKVSHAFAYFTLMFWFGQIYHEVIKRYLFAVMFILLGGLMEYMQSFDPARMAETADMLANGSGVIIGVLLLTSSARNILIRVEGFLFDQG